MRDYIIRRILLLVPVLLGISIFSFLLSHSSGDPIALYISPRTPPYMIDIIRSRYHLDEPIHVQYLYYLKGVLAGDFGYSRSQWMPVSKCILTFFPATFELAITALIFSVLIGVPLGILSASKKDKIADHFSRIFCLSGVSMPSFFLGLLFQYLFFYIFKSLGLPYFPVGNRVSTNVQITRISGLFLLDSLLTGNVSGFTNALWHITMPAIVVAMWPIATISRIMRSSMLEVLRQDYIILAKSKGLHHRAILYKHALKNAMIPTITAIGYCVGYLLTGSVMVEAVFSWPGLGRWAAHAIESVDVAAIVGFTMLTAFIFVITNLLVDVLYAWFDPRVRY